MEIIVKTIKVEDFSHLLRMMKKERLGDHTNNTSYLGAYHNGKLVGVVGWMIIGHVVRYKTDYVVDGYRKKGIYSRLFDAREDVVGKNADVVTAFCTEKSLPTYIRHGFIPKRERNGITFMERVKI